MEIVWKNLKVSEFYKICRLCLANKELEPLAEEEKSTLVKLTPWIAQLETSVYFPNKICTDCAKQLHEANEFLNRCNTLSNSFHKCLEDYKECAKEDRSLPSLEALLFPTKVKIKQEIEQSDNEIEEEASTIIPFTEVFLADDIKKEDLMEFEDTKFIPQQTTSHFVESNNAEFIESTPDIPVLEEGFEQGDSRNLPQISVYTIHHFYCQCFEESSAVSRTSAFWMEQYSGFHSDEAIGYIQVKRDQNNVYTVKAIISKSKEIVDDVVITVVIDEERGNVTKSICQIGQHVKGACSHTILLLFFLYRLNNFPVPETPQNYWCQSNLSILGQAPEPAKLEVLFPTTKIPSTNCNFLTEIKQAMMQDENYCAKLNLFAELKAISLYNLMLSFKSVHLKELKIITYEMFSQYCANTITNKTCELIREKVTVNPKDEAYYESIYCRITDSTYFDCLKNNANDALLSTIFCDTKIAKSKKTKKQKMKNIVLEIVEETMKFKSLTKGVIIQKDYPILAVCPDAVSDNTCLTIKIATKEKPKGKYLIESTGSLNEKYYVKIQLQMFIANKEYGIFCIAPENIKETKSVDAYRVELDRHLCLQSIKDAEEFWKQHVFPKLALV